jgi:hypothetical protein
MEPTSEQQGQVIELSEAEFKNQVSTARQLTNLVYERSSSLLMLGYNGAQIRALTSIYSAVEEGDAIDAKRNLNYPFYRHTAKFENSNGYLSFNFSGNKDFQVSGRVDDNLARRENFPVGTNPHLFLLQQRGDKDIQLDDLGERIFRGKYTGETGIVKKRLAKMKVTKEIPQVRDSYEAQWLDEETRMDAVFHFPARNEYVVFRKVKTSDGYEIWGERRNLRTDLLKQQLEEKKGRQVLSFQLSPQRIHA